MVHTELVLRLNDRQYTNWLKAGRCLLILKEALHPFIDARMRTFHRDLLCGNPFLRKPCHSLTCRPRRNKLSGACALCAEWQAEILRHHRQPEVTINWDNCYPPSWRGDHWEVAKAYMPRGQAKVKRADQCDAAALLNLINHCWCFQSVDTYCVREVISYRNQLMHSCELRVEDEWLQNFQTTLAHFTRLFRELPQMAAAGRQIHQMLSVDLSISVSGSDQLVTDALDGPETSADLISQWEAELLREKLQELFAVASEEESPQSLDRKEVSSLSGFLQANKDLSQRFSEELQVIALQAGTEEARTAD
ncbi:uncharacterized protein CXorf38 homolog [Synchiropus splendidus]|uniref:uncharacterized protein CXorf38 homolog n=1 Tax=Synchiropus splendidus TaxID=270530 RepID=UPI00237E2430|nr:uncharacterized protein CXorf38 homolog [Synchiropus splendidus]